MWNGFTPKIDTSGVGQPIPAAERRDSLYRASKTCYVRAVNEGRDVHDRRADMDDIDIKSTIVMVAGLALGSTLIFDISTVTIAAGWTAYVNGCLIACIAGYRASDATASAGWAWGQVALGAWTAACPFIWGFAGYTVPMASAVAVGVLALIDGILGGLSGSADSDSAPARS
jgi:hypothetical protein